MHNILKACTINWIYEVESIMCSIFLYLTWLFFNMGSIFLNSNFCFCPFSCSFYHRCTLCFLILCIDVLCIDDELHSICFVAPIFFSGGTIFNLRFRNLHQLILNNKHIWWKGPCWWGCWNYEKEEEKEMKLVHVPLLHVPPRISLHVSFNIVNPKALWPSGIIVICPFSETYIPLVVSSSLIGCYWQKHLSTMHKTTCRHLRHKNPL